MRAFHRHHAYARYIVSSNKAGVIDSAQASSMCLSIMAILVKRRKWASIISMLACRADDFLAALYVRPLGHGIIRGYLGVTPVEWPWRAAQHQAASQSSLSTLVAIRQSLYSFASHRCRPMLLAIISSSAARLRCVALKMQKMSLH